jgi:hypothetical protein
LAIVSVERAPQSDGMGVLDSATPVVLRQITESVESRNGWPARLNRWFDRCDRPVQRANTRSLDVTETPVQAIEPCSRGAHPRSCLS